MTSEHTLTVQAALLKESFLGCFISESGVVGWSVISWAYITAYSQEDKLRKFSKSLSNFFFLKLRKLKQKFNLMSKPSVIYFDLLI